MQTPFFYLLFFLGSGIFLSANILEKPFHDTNSLILSLLLLLISLTVILIITKTTFSKVWQTLVICLVFFFAGIQLYSERALELLVQGKKLSTQQYLLILPHEFKGQKNQQHALWNCKILEQTNAAFAQIYFPIKSKIQKDQVIRIAVQGNRLLFCHTTKGDWLLNRGIVAQGYMKQWQYYPKNYTTAGIIEIADKIKTYTCECISKYIKGKDNQAIALSVLFGIRNDISEELQGAYKQSGTVHLLAVSGMHVALLYQSILLLSFFLSNKQSSKLIKSIITLIVLWTFALLTGFSSSVVRAAVMLTISLIAVCVNRKTDPMNSLSAGAFLMLCYDPLYLFDIGFQLSCCAVAGIFLLNPFTKSIQENIFIKFFQSNIGISIAAQMGTLPICLYLNKSFPTYFLVANLLLVPLSSVLLLGTILLLSLSLLSPISSLIGQLLTYGYSAMNSLVYLFSELPYNTLSIHHFGNELAWGTALSLGLIAWWRINTNPRRTMIVLGTLLVFSILLLYYEIDQSTKPNLYQTFKVQNARCNLYACGRSLVITHTTNIAPEWNQVLRKTKIPEGRFTNVSFVKH